MAATGPGLQVLSKTFFFASSEESVSSFELSSGSALHAYLQRGNPFGDAEWSDKMVTTLGLGSTLRPQGRPKIQNTGS